MKVQTNMFVPEGNTTVSIVFHSKEENVLEREEDTDSLIDD